MESLIWKLSKQINFGLKSTLSKTLILQKNNYGNLDIRLSGSGKSTLAKNIIKKSKKVRFVHVDGDSIRGIYEKKFYKNYT